MSNVPKLRFKEFSGEWEEKLFKEVFERITTKNKENNLNVLTISAQQGLINQEEYFNKSVSAKNLTGYYLLNKDNFAYNKSYSKGYPLGAIKRLSRYEKGVVSTLYICFRAKGDSVDFFEQYFNSGNMNKEIHKIAQEGARNHGLLNISVTEFFNDTKLILPTKREQEKIASFLTSVDSKIQQLTKKESLLQDYKKGVMQKIFNQEIRFNDNNIEFKDWKEYKLKEFGKFYRGHSYNSSNVKEDGLLVLRSSNIQNDSIILDKDLQFVDKDCNNNITLQKNDIIICMANGSKKLVGKSAVYKGNYSKKLTVGAFCSILRAKSNFIIYILQSMQYRKYLHILLAGTNINNLKNSELEELKFLLPQSEKEQKKITNFISSIDKKIEVTKIELEKTKEFKKALLQQMFV